MKKIGDDSGYSVVAVSDGYVIAGSTSSFGNGSSDVYLLKTGPDGTLVLQKTLGETDYYWGQSLAAVNDGYVIAGAGTYIMKIGLDGNLTWQKTYDDEWGKSVAAVSDGYLITGIPELFSNGSQKLNIVKTDLDGNVLWQKTYDGEGSAFGYSVAAAGDGYIAVGSTYPDKVSNRDVYLVKTDLEGNSPNAEKPKIFISSARS